MTDFASASASFKVRNPHLFAPAQSAKSDGVDREIEDLHKPIIEWCRANRVPFIRARSDLPSTITLGAQDFTLFIGGRALCIECKTRTGKLTPDQIGWAMMMQRQGMTVHVVRTMAEFFKVVK